MPAARAKPFLPLKLLLAAILAVLAGFASATPAAAQDGASSQGPTAADWPQIVERARGQTVYFNAWGGDETVNAYIAWAGEQVPNTNVMAGFRIGLTALPDLAPGRYSVDVRVVSPGGYLAPMQLAVAGRAADGSYPLGTLQVQD